jgi:hypothetical protein
MSLPFMSLPFNPPPLRGGREGFTVYKGIYSFVEMQKISQNFAHAKAC